MKGNWDRGSNSSLISKRFSKLLLTFAMAAVITVAMAAPAAAEGTYYPEEVEEWGDVEMTPYLLFNATSGGALFVMQYGDQVLRDEITYEGDAGGAIVMGSHQELLKDHTYNIRLTFSGTADSTNTSYKALYGFSITESRPLLLSEIAPSPDNSIGTNYTDLVKVRILTNRVYTILDVVFSTADGYVDNSITGEVYINFLLNNIDVDVYNLEISTFSGFCRYDPDASYFTNIWGENLDNAADEFILRSDELAEHEQAISGMANEIRSGVIDQFTGMLSDVSSFISPTATYSDGSSSIYAPAMAFAGLYDKIVAALPPLIQALFSVVPMLAFLAWLFGFGRSL